MRRFAEILFITTLFFLVFNSSAAAQTSKEKPKIGLVLSGGGAKGFAHIGVLKVLEEVGIQPDYITGTSMGSIIGGLYSLGYSADELKTIVLGQNWPALFTDTASRRDISLQEKKEANKYVGGFPIYERKINLPSGLLAGQKVTALLTKLTWSAHHVHNFDDLPIPFRCVATNIENCEPVVLKNGYLPEAIRASMAIPSLFTPVTIDSLLLVDGGLARNFPVTEVREMGADIVIGVDVTDQLKSKDELNSVVKIVQQVINFQMVGSTNEQIRYCDIYIRPDLDEFTILDFLETDSILVRGEQMAQKMKPTLQHLADSLHLAENNKVLPKPATNLYELHISDISVDGLRNVSKELVLGKLGIDPNETITPEELEKAINRVYGSQFFERVTYQLEPTTVGSTLTIRVVEKAGDKLNFGLNYTSKHDAGILLNTTFRNLLGHGTKLSIDGRLGNATEFGGNYFYYTNFGPGIGLAMDMRGKDYYFDYYNSGKRIARYRFNNVTSDLSVLANMSNCAAIGLQLQYQRTELSPNIIPQAWSEEDIVNSYFNLAVFLEADSYDNAYFATRGANFIFEAKRLDVLTDSRRRDSFYRIFLNYSTAIPLSRKAAMHTFFLTGYIDKTDCPREQMFHFGGHHNYDNYMFSFIGLDFMQVPATNFLIGKLALQFEIFSQNFLTLEIDAGNSNQYYSDLFKQDNIILGAGLSYGVDTPLGPIKYTIALNDENRSVHSYITIGHWF